MDNLPGGEHEEQPELHWTAQIHRGENQCEFEILNSKLSRAILFQGFSLIHQFHGTNALDFFHRSI